MQRSLGCLKGKRLKISQLQEELQLCQGQVSELQGQLDEAKLSNQVRTKQDEHRVGSDDLVDFAPILPVCISVCIQEQCKCLLLYCY